MSKGTVTFYVAATKEEAHDLGGVKGWEFELFNGALFITQKNIYTISSFGEYSITEAIPERVCRILMVWLSEKLPSIKGGQNYDYLIESEE